MIAEDISVFKQGLAEPALPCLVAMTCLVQLPLLIVEECLAAEVAGVAVPHLSSSNLCRLLLFCRGGRAKLSSSILNQMHFCVLLQGWLVCEHF